MRSKVYDNKYELLKFYEMMMRDLILHIYIYLSVNYFTKVYSVCGHKLSYNAKEIVVTLVYLMCR